MRIIGKHIVYSIDFKQNFHFGNISLINFIYLSEDEINLVRDWRNNPDVRRQMYTDHIISAEEHLSFLQNLKQKDCSFYWMVKYENEPVGVISLKNVDFLHKHAYYGIYSNPSCNVLGLGRLLDKASLSLVFDAAKFNTLKLEVIEDNRKVVNLHKKMGFKIEGYLRDFVFKDNTWKNVIIMGQSRREWESMKAGI